MHAAPTRTMWTRCGARSCWTPGSRGGPSARSIACSPARPDAYGLLFERGRACLALGRIDRAARDFGRAIAGMPQPRPEHVIARRDALLALGRLSDAVAALDEGMARLGPIPSLELPAVELDLDLGRYDRALRRLDTLLAQRTNPVWVARRGDVLVQAGRPTEARREYLRALTLIRSRRAPAFEDIGRRLETSLVSTAHEARHADDVLGRERRFVRGLRQRARRRPVRHPARRRRVGAPAQDHAGRGRRLKVRNPGHRHGIGPADASKDERCEQQSCRCHFPSPPWDDTQYYYAVGSVAGALVGDDADHWFRTAPSTGMLAPLRIWTIGDAGFTGANLDAVRDAYVTFNGSSAADLFVLLGDNAYLTGTDAQYQAAVFDEHAAMLRTTPVYSVFGNHEAFSANSLTQVGPYFDMWSFPTAAEAGGVASGTESYFSFDYANVHFVVLDSEQAPTSSSTPMLTWLEADLQATTADWVIALWHRPPYSRGLLHDSDVETQEINIRRYALPFLESYGVDAVLCGHSHNYERSYFLDGHYGASGTFSSANQVDAGDGDPAGDGPYRKTGPGPTPHSGAVFVVNGSGSEVRPATLNYPAMLVGLLELGSVVLDIDGNSLTARMLDSAAQVRDTFRIVKSAPCATVPAAGCGAAVKGTLSLKTDVDPARNKWSWKWKDGALPPAAAGNPTAQTDLAVCVYDAGGLLVGGSVPHGAGEWSVKKRASSIRTSLRRARASRRSGSSSTPGRKDRCRRRRGAPRSATRPRSRCRRSS